MEFGSHPGAAREGDCRDNALIRFRLLQAL